MKKLFYLALTSIILSSCNWFHEKPEIALKLAEHFQNDLYKKFDTAAYKLVFTERLKKAALTNPKVIHAYFDGQELLPNYTTQFFFNGQLDSLISYLERSKDDGFNADIFKGNELRTELEKLKQNRFSSIDEVYPVVAAIEIKTAECLLKYTNFLKYGAINPRNILNRYYIKNKRPDSAGMMKLLLTKQLVADLKAAQPKSKAYLELKKQLAFYRDSIKNDNNFAIRQIKLNLERLRWQLPVQEEEMVVVNIPDFSLTWFKGNDTLAHMNVCVGEKREAAYADKIKTFMKTGKLEDKPKNHETPQLVSVFNAIQVNPVWNIPTSIAKSEIYWMARKNPFYLEHSNIKVYKNGRLIEEPDTIDWNKYNRDKLPFSFKQGSGEGNALGKFKFEFESSSSIYLHDTNNKYGFKLANRAISHGCVRIENPLKFAELMVKNKYQYDDLRMEVKLPPVDTNLNKKYQKKLAARYDTAKVFKLKPSWFAVRKNVGVVLAYYTAWAENGKVEFRPDVYAYDDLIWASLKKYM